MIYAIRGLTALTWLSVIVSLLGCQPKPEVSPKLEAAPQPPAPPVALRDGGVGAGVTKSISSVNRVVFANHLKNIGTAYQVAANLGKPPASVADLDPNDIRQQLPFLKDGTFVILWGSDPQNAPGGASNTVLGYIKDVPENGGVVLMLDGTLRPNMTPAEFKAAPKRKK
jgi:hypothetical protein